MASERVNPNPNDQKLQVIHAIQPWLNSEVTHRKTATFLAHRGSAAETRDYLLDEEVPNEWNLFQDARLDTATEPDADRRKLQVAQNVLRACAAAQIAFIWDQVDQHDREIDEAKGHSLVAIDIFEQDWRNRPQLPDVELLTMPIPQAVDEYDGRTGAYYRPVRVFRALLALSATAIVEQGIDASGPLLPEPGADSGVLNPWKHE